MLKEINKLLQVLNLYVFPMFKYLSKCFAQIYRAQYGAAMSVHTVRTLFQKQISRTFPGLFQNSDWFFKGSKIRFGPYTPEISMLIFLTAFYTLHIF